MREKYGLEPEQIIDMKGLMGDQSDNIPGVPGVGEKTAIKLLKQFPTVEQVLASIEDVSGKKLKENLNKYEEQALMSKELAKIITDAPVQVSVDDLVYERFDSSTVTELFKELEFQSLLDKMDPDGTSVKSETMDALSYEIVTEIKEDLLGDEAALYVEIFEENYHIGEINGFGLRTNKGLYFIPTPVAFKSPIFKHWLENPAKKKYVYDAKRSFVALKHHDINLKGVTFDLLIASYLLNPSAANTDFSGVAKRHGYTEVQSDEAVFGKGAKRKLPEEKILAEHVARKSEGIFALYEHCVTELKNNHQYELFHDLELPLSFVLAEMEFRGVKVDVNRLQEMQIEVSERLDAIEQKIFSLAGEKFNVNSPKQLGVILFEKLGLPVIRKTKTGYSTAADVLEKLEPKHEIIREILHYRQLGKLQSTYIEGLLKVVHKDTNKVHTRFNQALTQTGRLSSTDPNLQNIPIRLEEGRKIRQIFVPSKKDWVIFAADYSQVELRVLAHIANDKRLIEAFQSDLDIHLKTAMDVFHVEKDEVTPEMRRQAKAVNFGIVYGISDYGLSQNLGITRKEAGIFIKRYFESFPNVKEYMENIVREAKEKGYVTTLLQRRRYIPEITSKNYNIRSFGERTAMNTPIQGSAADIIKKAMIDMTEKLKAENLSTKLLLQVHDELIFEAPREELDILKKIVPEVMEQAIDLVVPLKVDYSFGDTWYDAR